ncbi:hypothetical protein OSJ77_03695 [Phyllobacterium sp. 0TCS1.6C]|uniref:hypothetical protein n=1 Tax=unclassified Phyllobacterium TaxID=2638441 RepID=UPI0022653491|nr:MULTISPECIES: hypothetical protein [unclassified Phyllobacterium]MCX8279278.1 hypothetical protein [Phyllobacterium sp. 0TCS1.6C]MCX8294062.1 hypothetical protein [Phyllobacterium sp. 0TCS1.6A]
MLRPVERGFFVGYFKKVPPDVRVLMIGVILFFIAAMASASALLSLNTDSPGSGSYADDLSGEHLIGTMEIKPYPILRIPADGTKPARAVMLAGSGKFGIDDRALPLTGKTVRAGGVFVKRGDLTMLLIGGEDDLKAADPQMPALPATSAPENLGSWRLTGEICDGKCSAGAMKPGTGLAHKACANLCISGGVPPVFVSTAPIHGHMFFLLASKDGGPMPTTMLDKTGVPIVLEGSLERRDDLLIMKIDKPASETGA